MQYFSIILNVSSQFCNPNLSNDILSLPFLKLIIQDMWYFAEIRRHTAYECKAIPGEFRGNFAFISTLMQFGLY